MSRHIGPLYLGSAVCRDCGARVVVHARVVHGPVAIVPIAHGPRARRCAGRGFVGPIQFRFYAWMRVSPDAAWELVGIHALTTPSPSPALGRSLRHYLVHPIDET